MSKVLLYKIVEELTDTIQVSESLLVNISELYYKNDLVKPQDVALTEEVNKRLKKVLSLYIEIVDKEGLIDN